MNRAKMDLVSKPERIRQLLQMYYQGCETSMVIVLPDEVEGLNSVLQKLAEGHNIMADIENLSSTQVDLMIPKFKVETTIDLKELLPKLGIKSIFKQEESDIDILTSNEKLFVSEAIQKAFIVVDEKGTEAAAASSMVEVPLCRLPTGRFVADRPFLYLLIARKIPIFIGIYEGSEYAQISPPEFKKKNVNFCVLLYLHDFGKYCVKAMNGFEKRMELGRKETTICSPLSAEIVLALLALGCKNQSHAELLKALDFPNDKALRSSFASLKSTLKSIKGATVNVSNKVYVKQGGKLKPGIQKDAKKVFRASLEQLDFKEKQAAAAVINNWVAQQTNDKIKDIISPSMLSANSSLVLVNAIYFQGLWEQQFYSSETDDRPFHINNTTTITIPQMTMNDKCFNYRVSPELKARLLQMHYKGGETCMVIVLPDQIEGLNTVLQKLASGYNVINDIESMTSTYLNIVIPKFKVETTINLKELLPKLGIESIFKPETSEIDMLTSNETLFVSEAVQKAFIAVDEMGTEAAACTMFEQRICCGRLHRVENFVADRPFLYLLLARQIPLFIGIYEGSSDGDSNSVAQVKRDTSLMLAKLSYICQQNQKK